MPFPLPEREDEAAIQDGGVLSVQAHPASAVTANWTLPPAATTDWLKGLTVTEHDPVEAFGVGESPSKLNTPALALASKAPASSAAMVIRINPPSSVVFATVYLPPGVKPAMM